MTLSVDREIAVVQFPHPGREWGPNKGTLHRDWTDWNDGHARKFLVHRGKYLDDGDKAIEAVLTFWGEWEGPSECLPTGAIGDGMPGWFLLFGSLSPNVTAKDVLSITRLLIENYSPQVEAPKQLDGWLNHVIVDAEAPAWLQGNTLADDVHDWIGSNASEYVDVEKILESVGVSIRSIELSDRDIRSLAIAGPHQRPVVFLNLRYRNGTSDPVRRFSLAHELCHLLLDRDRATRLAVASGPWTPLDVEQRANAFAAAFLLPDMAIDYALNGMRQPVRRMSTITRIAHTYGVSRLTTIERLYNVGVLDREYRDELRAVAMLEFSERSDFS